MSLLISNFEGLTERDFDVYQSKCWSSNLYNLDRMKAKERLKTLAKGLSALLGQGDTLTLEASSEIPSVWNGRVVQDQWAYVLRSKAERKTLQPIVSRNLDLATRVKDPAEHHQHLLLAMRLDETGVEVAVRANEHATVDLANLLGRAEAEPDVFSGLLKALPDSVQLNGLRATAGLVMDATRATRAGDSQWLTIGHVFPKAQALALGTGLVDAVAEIVTALAPLYRFIAWRTENDHIGVSATLEEAASTRAARAAEQAEAKAAADSARVRRTTEAEKRTAAKQAAQDAWATLTRKVRMPATPKPAPKPMKPAPRPAKSPVAQDAASTKTPAARPEKTASPSDRRPRREERPQGRQSGPARGSEREPRAPRRDARPSKAEHRRGKPGDPPKTAKLAEAAPAQLQPVKARPAAELVVGDACRLTRGLLAGKQAVIKSKDKKGYYRVSVGGLEVSVAGTDLEGL